MQAAFPQPALRNARLKTGDARQSQAERPEAMHRICYVQHFVGNGTMQQHNERMVIRLSPTAPLEKVPSGHLAMVIDGYERLQARQGGLPTTPIQLHANLPEYVESDSSDKDTEITCNCGDRDCAECGQLFLSRHSEN